MGRREEIQGFLTSRRARLDPKQAGVTVHGSRRRVPGLRREEVAHLAGVSTDYYARLERGTTKGASLEVLDAIARALQLDDTERGHLIDLISVRSHRRRRTSSRVNVSGTLQAVLDALLVPAVVQNSRLDIVAANLLGRALYGLPEAPGSVAPFNAARFQFLDPNAATFYFDFDRARRNCVALLHKAVGTNPHDEDLVQLIGELSARSQEFRRLWASHDVLRHQGGVKRYRHPQVGDLEFGYEALLVPAAPELTMLVYTVEPDSRTADAMHLLAAWNSPSQVRAS
ncbi:helix-turn-helix domain-containing protein [Curtobacterium sp. USHLN213]|uniref:helix-turn-helix domain-containing protein n=1 Tax=Curtobacterium sp. USHLN213 TaxID=3081255 RepID=UPI0030165944